MTRSQRAEIDHGDDVPGVGAVGLITATALIAYDEPDPSVGYAGGWEVDEPLVVAEVYDDGGESDTFTVVPVAWAKLPETLRESIEQAIIAAAERDDAQAEASHWADVAAEQRAGG